MSKIINLSRIILVGAMFLTPALLYASTPYVSTVNATSVTTNSAFFNAFANSGDLPTVAWFEYGIENRFNNSSQVNFGAGESRNYTIFVGGLEPSTTYTFRAVVQNIQGRVYGNTYSFTTRLVNPINTYYVNNNNINYLSLNSITEPATSVGSTSAKLNALIYNEASDSSNTYFEWGTTMGLGHRTTVVQTGTLPVVKHVDTLTGLSPNTKYYFRAVTENSYQSKNGSILSFVTNSKSAPSISATITKTEANANAGLTQSLLGASAISTGSFLPSNISNWLLLIILLLILIILGKHTKSLFK